MTTRDILRSSPVLLVVLLAAAGASAQARIVVADFDGAGSGAIRNQAVRGLSGEDGIELVSSDDFEAAGGLGDLETAAADLNVTAVVEGRVARRGRRWVARITVRSAAGEEVGEHDFVSRNLRGLGSAVRRRVARVVEDAIEGLEAPAASPAAAPSGGGSRVVVRGFDGPGAGRARGIVVEELQGHVELVPFEDADSVADALDVELSDPDGRVAVAAELGVHAWVDGEVRRRGRRGYVARVWVTNGADGEELGDATFRGRNAGQLVARMRGGIWDRIGSAVSSGTAPPPPSGGDDAEDAGDEDFEDEEFEDEDFEDEGPGGPRPPALEAAASFRILSRSLSYKDDIFGMLRAYQLGGAPALGVEVHWYPGAHFTDGFAANLGLDFRGEVGIGLESEDSAHTEYPTETSAWSLGARYRIGMGSMEIAPLLHYGRHYYSIEAANVDNPKPDVPDVAYRFLRIGADWRMEVIDSLSVRARLAWLHVISAGEIGTDVWFPRLDVSGIEVAAGVGYQLADGLEVRAEVDVRRYFYTMNPEPGDPWIAGGAADQYLAGSLGVAWTP